MPYAAPRPCNHPGCGALVRDGSSRCDAHKRAERQQSDAKRGSSHERGYTAAWQRARAGFLAKHPLCTRCDVADQVEPATVVDHIKPHRLKDAMDSGNEAAIAAARALFWARGNWQGLCKRHHDIKTASEDGGFGRR